MSHSNFSLRSSEITIQSLSLETEKGTTIIGDTRRSDSPCSISLSIDQKPPRPPFRNLSLERVSSGSVFLEDRCPSRSWHGLRGRPGAGARGISRPGCDIDRSNAPKGRLDGGWISKREASLSRWWMIFDRGRVLRMIFGERMEDSCVREVWSVWGSVEEARKWWIT